MKTLFILVHLQLNYNTIIYSYKHNSKMRIISHENDGKVYSLNAPYSTDSPNTKYTNVSKRTTLGECD